MKGRPISLNRSIFCAPWRDLPEEFGKWQTVWRLFDQWNGDGTLDKLLQRMQGEILINTEL
ncbi:MAG: transposase, partial [Proteobacteria bacterium]|nr:transposase [Pseudomonadota bacterium]